MEAKEVTFEDKQKAAYAFLDAYYTRADFGYDVKRWRPEDVTQTIIDIVEQMGNDIYTNTKVLAVASEIFKKLASFMTNGTGFLISLYITGIAGSSKDIKKIMETTRDNITKDIAIYKKNKLAWAVVTQVMAREKGNIELAFLGFM